MINTPKKIVIFPKNTVTGPLRDRYGGSVNFRECTHFSYKKCLRRPFTLKSTVTGPLRDRYGTVTGPLREHWGHHSTDRDPVFEHHLGLISLAVGW